MFIKANINPAVIITPAIRKNNGGWLTQAMTAPAVSKKSQLDVSGAAQQDFLRYEFKYILPRALRDDIEKSLQPFIQFDPFVSSVIDHQYLVRSLYFDDPEFTSYYDKEEGVKIRAKFRLRTYDDTPTVKSKVFLELKGRYNQRVFKRRIDLLRGEEQEFEVGEQQVAKKILRCVPAGSMHERFEYELHRKQLEPVLMVEYMRRPYFSRYSEDFRLTFDDHLSATKTKSIFPEANASKRMILPGYSVMEVKFMHQIPSWFHRILQNYELERVPISKICRGMETWGMVDNPEA
jgi:hypothetical protein